MKSTSGLSYMTRDDLEAMSTVPLGDAARIFISYKKHEKKQVTDEGLIYTRDLAAKRIVNLSPCAVWHDGFLTPGEDYHAEIKSAILESDAVILLLTSNVLESQYIWNTEITLAMANNKPIIPIAFDLPSSKYGEVERRLGSTTHIINWPGGDDDTPQSEPEFNDSLSRILDRLAVSSSLSQEINKIKPIMESGQSLIYISPYNWYLMGCANLDGICTAKNTTKGIDLLESVAYFSVEGDDVNDLRCKAANALFTHYYGLHKSDPDNYGLKECRKYAELGTELGDAELTYRRGFMYRTGRGAGRDLDKAAELYTVAAKLGNAKGQCALGVMYRNGESVPKDYAKAFELFSLAAAQGNGDAMWNLAELYSTGNGTTRNEQLAESWYIKAAQLNGGSAMRRLGDIYEKEKDMAAAFKWYHNSAQQGDSIAMRNLGDMYRKGLHVEKDYGKAFGWYYRAAVVGNFVAMRRLGIMFHRGFGVDISIEKSEEWFERSAEFGGIRAMTSLGQLYYNGKYIDGDIYKAIGWYERAAGLGSPEALRMLEKLKQEVLLGLHDAEKPITPNESLMEDDEERFVEPTAPAFAEIPTVVPEQEYAAPVALTFPAAPLTRKEIKAAQKAEKLAKKEAEKAAKAAAKAAKKAARSRFNSCHLDGNIHCIMIICML